MITSENIISILQKVRKILICEKPKICSSIICLLQRISHEKPGYSTYSQVYPQNR